MTTNINIYTREEFVDFIDKLEYIIYISSTFPDLSNVKQKINKEQFKKHIINRFEEEKNTYASIAIEFIDPDFEISLVKKLGGYVSLCIVELPVHH